MSPSSFASRLASLRAVRVALAGSLVALAIMASVALAGGPAPTVLPVEPDGGIGGEVVLPVEPDGGIGN